MKLRIYLDTSVFSVYYDERTPERQAETRAFWLRLDAFEAASSELAREELLQTPDDGQRAMLLGLMEGFAIHPITEDMKTLAHRYVEKDVFPVKVFNDALHVAAAVLTRQDILVSWNFKHLVNRQRRAKVNDINTSLGLPTIEIVPPPEV